MRLKSLLLLSALLPLLAACQTAMPITPANQPPGTIDTQPANLNGLSDSHVTERALFREIRTMLPSADGRWLILDSAETEEAFFGNRTYTGKRELPRRVQILDRKTGELRSLPGYETQGPTTLSLMRENLLWLRDGSRWSTHAPGGR